MDQAHRNSCITLERPSWTWIAAGIHVWHTPCHLVASPPPHRQGAWEIGHRSQRLWQYRPIKSSDRITAEHASALVMMEVIRIGDALQLQHEFWQQLLPGKRAAMVSVLRSFSSDSKIALEMADLLVDLDWVARNDKTGIWILKLPSEHSDGLASDLRRKEEMEMWRA